MTSFEIFKNFENTVCLWLLFCTNMWMWI